ncbi:MAG: methyltransferase domain-containing protein [Bacteroidetes bacterium]|nr:MAG: methyltransferase domain-containing protein [Bacteroidota bacterium]
MTALDKWLQQQRIRRAISHLPPGAFVLDVGCHQGELLLHPGINISGGVGIDPLCSQPNTESIRFIKGAFPQAVPLHLRFDAITALALVEHLPQGQHAPFFAACAQLLKPNGLVICTVPHARVDSILHVLTRLRLIKGMSIDEHHGYNVLQTPEFAGKAGLHQLKHQPFQLGLNHLFVFQKKPH